MFRLEWRLGFAAVVAIILLVTAQPAMAFKRTGQTGAIGAYHIQDSLSLSGAECVYKDGPGGLVQLGKMYVYTPDVKARPGMGTQKVGWQYTIQRKIQGQGGWTNRLTSKIFTAYTNSSSYADFPNKRAKVIVPNGPDGPTASYRALIKILWYNSNGSAVAGSVSGRMEYYFLNGAVGSSNTVHGSCFDYELG